VRDVFKKIFSEKKIFYSELGLISELAQGYGVQVRSRSSNGGGSDSNGSSNGSSNSGNNNGGGSSNNGKGGSDSNSGSNGSSGNNSDDSGGNRDNGSSGNNGDGGSDSNSGSSSNGGNSNNDSGGNRDNDSTGSSGSSNSHKAQQQNILFAGTITKRKGVHILIDALNTINKQGTNFNCTIVGMAHSGDKYGKFILNKIEKYKLKDKITLAGHVSETKLAEYYSRADIFAFPSMLEGYGMVLLEAMSFALPVVAFNNSAMPYTVKDGINGLLCKNGNVTDFAEKLRTLINDNALWKKLSKGALQTSKQTRKMTDMYPNIDKFIQWLS
jgi:glycosyltransferase involved in cell wall biosynthesis